MMAVRRKDPSPPKAVHTLPPWSPTPTIWQLKSKSNSQLKLNQDTLAHKQNCSIFCARLPPKQQWLNGPSRTRDSACNVQVSRDFTHVTNVPHRRFFPKAQTPKRTCISLAARQNFRLFQPKCLTHKKRRKKKLTVKHTFYSKLKTPQRSESEDFISPVLCNRVPLCRLTFSSGNLSLPPL